MKGLTERQEDILSMIILHVNRRGYCPTLREIGKHFGITSTNGVNDHLWALERKGYIRRTETKSRSIEVIRLPSGVGVKMQLVEVHDERQS